MIHSTKHTSFQDPEVVMAPLPVCHRQTTSLENSRETSLSSGKGGGATTGSSADSASGFSLPVRPGTKGRPLPIKQRTSAFTPDSPGSNSTYLSSIRTSQGSWQFLRVKICVDSQLFTDPKTKGVAPERWTELFKVFFAIFWLDCSLDWLTEKFKYINLFPDTTVTLTGASSNDYLVPLTGMPTRPACKNGVEKQKGTSTRKDSRESIPERYFNLVWSTFVPINNNVNRNKHFCNKN